jgi:hypothetical protein
LVQPPEDSPRGHGPQVPESEVDVTFLLVNGNALVNQFQAVTVATDVTGEACVILAPSTSGLDELNIRTTYKAGRIDDKEVVLDNDETFRFTVKQS